MRVQVAQGELLFVPREDLPMSAQKVAAKGAIVLSRGSTTPHTHEVLSKDADYYDNDGREANEPLIGFLKVKKAAASVTAQDRHPPQVLSKGVWEVRKQREDGRERPQLVSD